jgi:hypothetical protein
MILTERDLEIVRFILNMKFASVADIHQKFFKQRKDGGISTSEWYARERLRELLMEGYINCTRYRFENKCYYVGTKYGYQLIEKNCCSESTAKPIDRIDVRTFDHDINVMKSRLLLEEHDKVSSWLSDRQLKAHYDHFFRKNKSRDSAPDGVYKSLGGKIIAFEYEIAQKSKRRYQDKVRRYIDCIRASNISDRPKYDHVRFVCEKESVRNVLADEVRLYREHFTVEVAYEFFERFKIQTDTLMKNAPMLSLVR